MSEEMNNKAVELSDEEMDKIAGGKAIVVWDTGLSRVIHSCNKKVNASDLSYYLWNSIGCSRFSKISGLPDYNDPDFKDCRDCVYYHCTGHRLDEAERAVDPKTYQQRGYDFIYQDFT